MGQERHAIRRRNLIALGLFTALWLVIGTFLWGQTPAQPQNGTQSAVKILTPRAGEELNTNIVRCKYELVQPATANGLPTFKLQLDDQEPVRTVMMDHTFTGLKDGPHEITVIVLDANDKPLPGTMAEVHFKVLPQTPPKPLGAHGQYPGGGSPLPLLSVICGGALAGGTISVLRNRGRRKRS